VATKREPRLVSLGYGRFVRADRIYALVPLGPEERGEGRRTYVHVEGLSEPLVASRSEKAVRQGAAANQKFSHRFIEVTVGDGMPGFIRKTELSRDRSEQRPDRFAVGEKVDAKVTAIDRATRKLTLSIKAREVDEEKRAMAEFGSSDSGASLGDILGAAINRARRQGDTDRQAEAEAEEKS